MPGRLLERCRKIVFFTFFLFFLTFPMLASAYAQLRKVSFEVQNVNLAEIIAILEKSTNYTFLYQDEQVERVKNLTFHFVDEKLSDVLEKCLADTDLDYSIVDQTVVLRVFKLCNTFCPPIRFSSSDLNVVAEPVKLSDFLS